MDNLSEIIKQRSEPGIMIFDLTGRLLYSNREGMELFAALQMEKDSTDSFPEAICNFCRKLREGTDLPDFKVGINYEHKHPVFAGNSEAHYAVRPFLIGDPSGANPDTHVLILIEKVVERRKFDIEKARKEFRLTRREAEMVRLISGGFTNREIAEKKFISEYTVKVHIRNIMKKMNAGSRNEVVAMLK